MGNMGTGGATGSTGPMGDPGPVDTGTTSVKAGGACNTTPGDPSAGLFTMMCVAGALLLVRRRSA
jgi:uncharacterized protein (TIGR03382 family)